MLQARKKSHRKFDFNVFLGSRYVSLVYADKSETKSSHETLILCFCGCVVVRFFFVCFFINTWLCSRRETRSQRPVRSCCPFSTTRYLTRGGVRSHLTQRDVQAKSVCKPRSEQFGQARDRAMGLLLFFSVETWILLITFICIFVTYGHWNYGVLEKLGVPGPKPVMYFGTIGQHNRVYYLDDVCCAHKYGRVWGMYELKRPILAVMDPDMLKTILVKECFAHFTNRRNFRLNGDLYDAVSILEDDDWRRIRNILTPLFTSGRIKEMFSIMKHHSRKLTDKLQSTVDNDEVINVKDFFGGYSMDVLTSCALSVDLDSISNPSNPFITHSGKMFRFSIPLFIFQGCFPFFLPLLELLGFSFFSKSSTAFFKAVLEKIRAERNGSSEQTSRDIFQHMINSQTVNEHQDEKKNKVWTGLTDHEILSQMTILLIAGFETSATTLVFLAYNLARNPEVMNRLQKEIDSTFPNKGPVEYEALMQMEYLDSVVNECLRKKKKSPASGTAFILALPSSCTSRTYS
ncbi:cytochrome P450 3A30-like isoform X2 [Xiphias gladius]|uniref:cytochrome P450 3A30-like isoform X2 n=1 Tax=Xiphias gladius TaxID=8245 RepID=UPI001A9A19FA|nr:cytochrome P450 3A30-like isoform X2 [Xiphias gladius]